MANTPFGRIANVICYDVDFPAPLTGIDADILLVPGGDWPEFGRIHTLRMASLRAVENGYALFRQDFNGLSAAFDRHGNVLAMQDTTRSDKAPSLLTCPLAAHFHLITVSATCSQYCA